MSGTLVPPPTAAGFSTFVFQIMGVPATALPSDAPVITAAFNAAANWVNPMIGCLNPYDGMYAVYNLAADRLARWAPDGTGSDPTSTAFATMRKNLGLNSFVAGVVGSAADVSTSDALVVPDWFKNITLADIQDLGTPWGRAYLAIAQQMGTLWGIS